LLPFLPARPRRLRPSPAAATPGARHAQLWEERCGEW
jgi:hypothetical protein